MATTYTLYFTDTTKIPFSIQPYTANGPISPTNNTTIEGATKADTTLKLYGRGMKDYGEGIFQNMVYMLENFANPFEPVYSKEGQLWYNTSTGSPPSLPRLAIRNNTDWDNIILATGSAAMTAELTLAGNPTEDNHAITKLYLETQSNVHASDYTLHLETYQNEYLDNLLLSGAGSPPNASPFLTYDDTNQLIGITGNVQGQFDTVATELLRIEADAVSKSNSSWMNPGVNITFTTDGLTPRGEVLGLPDVPTADGAATSKKYVDTQISNITTADGALESTGWGGVTIGSPPTIPNASDTTLELIITVPNQANKTIYAEGISRSTHIHQASTITVDLTGSPIVLPPAYGFDVQSSLEYIETNKANILNPTFTNDITIIGDITNVGSISSGGSITAIEATYSGNVTALYPSNSDHLATKQYVDDNIGGTAPPTGGGGVSSRLFNILAADLISPATYSVQQHTSEDNSISLTINGLKQYTSTRGIQRVEYFGSIINISNGTPTGLDSNTQYNFALTIDGNAPITIAIPTTINVSTHGALVTAINNAINDVLGSPLLNGANYRIFNNGEIFTSNSQSGTSNVVISDPGGVDTYLFAVDASPKTIIDATFVNPGSPPTIGGSPPIPNTVIFTGDITATFPVNKKFSIIGSDETANNYGPYDGIYSVHVNGATFNGVNTIVPVAAVNDNTVAVALYPSYDPASGAPLPAPTPFGDVYVTPLSAIRELAASIQGLEGDYIETDASGNQVPRNTITSNVVFNYDILSGSSIESLSFG